MRISSLAPRSRAVTAVTLAALAITLVGSTPASATNGLTGSSLNGADGNLTTSNGSHLQSPDGTFDTASAGTTDTEDWASTTACTGTTIVGCRQGGIDQTRSQTDNSLGQGTKEDSPAPTVTQGSIPNNKSDLSRFYVQNERGTIASHDAVILDLAWERVNTLGTANMDFEFNQSKCYGTTTSGCNTPVNTTANLNTPARTPGDVLITFDFANGGNTVNLGLLRWLTSGHGNTSDCFSSSSLPCWGKRVDLNSAVIPSTTTHIAQGAVNDGFTVTEPIASTTLAADTFGEASIDLTDVPGLFTAGVCTTLGSAWLKSRSSASFTAEEKDFIAPVKVEVSNCGSATIYKQDTTTSTHTALSGTTFTVYKDNTPTGNPFHDPAKLYASTTQTTTLDGAISDTDTSVHVVDDVSGWATTPFYVKVGDEGMKVTAVSLDGKTLTVERGAARTTAIAHASGAVLASATFGEDSFLTDGSTTLNDTTDWTSTAPANGGTFKVADVTALPASGSFYAIVDNEVIQASVTDATNKVLTLDATAGRAQDGTVAAAHSKTAALKLLFYCSPSGSISASAGTPAFTGTASSCTITNIPFGSYWIAETAAPSGYNVADPGLVAISGSTPDPSVLFGDAQTPTTFSVIKTDDRDGGALPVNICTGSSPAGSCAGFTLYQDAAPTGTAWHDPTKYYDTPSKTTTLGAAITSTSTTVITADVSSWGTLPSTFVIKIDSELMNVTGVSAPTLTVTRGFGGTTAATHAVTTNDVALMALGEDGVSAGTCTVLNAATDPNKCTFSSVLPGHYWAVETTVPTGYAAGAPQPVSYSAGGTQPADLTFVNHRLFKVLVFVCTQNNDGLYQANVTLAGSTKTSAATLSGTGVDATSLCQLTDSTGGAVFKDQQKDGGVNVGDSGYTTHLGDVHIGYAKP